MSLKGNTLEIYDGSYLSGRTKTNCGLLPFVDELGIFHMNWEETWLYLVVEKNEENTQLIAYLAGREDMYVKINQPVVIYEGDVSSLTDTSTIAEELPEEVIFTVTSTNLESGYDRFVVYSDSDHQGSDLDIEVTL